MPRLELVDGSVTEDRSEPSQQQDVSTRTTSRGMCDDAGDGVLASTLAIQFREAGRERYTEANMINQVVLSMCVMVGAGDVQRGV